MRTRRATKKGEWRGRIRPSLAGIPRAQSAGVNSLAAAPEPPRVHPSRRAPFVCERNERFANGQAGPILRRNLGRRKHLQSAQRPCAFANTFFERIIRSMMLAPGWHALSPGAPGRRGWQGGAQHPRAASPSADTVLRNIFPSTGSASTPRLVERFASPTGILGARRHHEPGSRASSTPAPRADLVPCRAIGYIGTLHGTTGPGAGSRPAGERRLVSPRVGRSAR